MSHEDFTIAIKPKVQGSWNLHTLLPPNLDFFILFSSASGITGNRGQANYCVGNTYQDALAHHRVAHGQKAVCLDLGMILSVGFAAENPKFMANLRASGFNAIREEEYHALLNYFCDPHLSLPTQLSCQVALGMETPEALQTKGIAEPFWMQDPLFRHMYQIRRGPYDGLRDSGGADTINYAAILAAAESAANAAEVVQEAVIRKLCNALTIQPEDVDATMPLHTYGVDSLVVVEMRSWLAKDMGADIPVFDIMRSVSIAALAGLVVGRSKFLQNLPGA